MHPTYTMGIDQKIRVGGKKSTLLPKTFNKRTMFLLFILIIHCTISTEVTALATTKLRLHLRHRQSFPHKFRKVRTLRRNKIQNNTRSKVSVPEALGCDAGLTRSVFMYMDDICHRCFNLFREIEIYYMCRYFFK